jgi:protein involved in polysaccharide export with SLBB domain
VTFLFKNSKKTIRRPCIETMKKNLFAKFLIWGIIFSFAAISNVFAQKTDTKISEVNFRYSRNPKIRSTVEAGSAENAEVNKPDENAANKTAETNERSENPPDASKKNTDEKQSELKNFSPTEIYKVGVGDILFINLQNSSDNSTYYTVLNDGTIDYPLAGEMVSVSGLTTEEIEKLLSEKVKLYENPKIFVKIREYASHVITVLGLVEKPGEMKIQREAVPLYVVRAETIVQPKATRAVIRRINTTTEIIDLKDLKSDEVLIFPGDIVEFSAENESEATAKPQFYYIGGEVVSGGQKIFHSGITLTQAILASGGLRKPTIKKIVIRRKNFQGLLVASTFDLRTIKDGKVPDPVLEIGDTVEIGN